MTLPPDGSLGSRHVRGTAGIRRGGRAGGRAVAQAARMASAAAALPEWSSRYRFGGGERRVGRLRRGEGSPAIRFRRSGRGSALAKAAGAGEVGGGLDRSPWPAERELPFRRD